MLRTLALPSFVFVWPSNCGSCSLTETTAVNPSMKSSVESELSDSLSMPRLRA